MELKRGRRTSKGASSAKKETHTASAPKRGPALSVGLHAREVVVDQTLLQAVPLKQEGSQAPQARARAREDVATGVTNLGLLESIADRLVVPRLRDNVHLLRSKTSRTFQMNLCICMSL